MRIALGFIALILIFSRAGIIYNLFPKINHLLGFTGFGVRPLSFTSRFAQYSEFVYYSFFSPNAGVHIGKNISWQLNPVTSINYIGLVILAVSILGAVINRNSKICRIAFMWVVYSFMMLCALGWGTAENGLILYTLYFSWAFYILVFMLALRVRFLVPVIAAGAVYVLVRVSLPAIVKVVEFGVKYYPFTW